jgi:hypothetical protein
MALEFIELRNFPESKLCMAVRDAVGSIKKDGQGLKIMTLPFRNYSILKKDVKDDFPVKEINFYAYRVYPVKAIFVFKREWGDEEVEMDWSIGHYLIDIDNDGVRDLIEITGDKYGEYGAGNTMKTYQKVWIFDNKPARIDSMPLKTIIDPWNSVFFSQTMGFSNEIKGAYYIAPFSFAQKNYLLFESNEDYAGKLFWVGELLPDGKPVTHCYF